MIAIPTIRLRNGGAADSQGPDGNRYDPIALARVWANAGFRRAHVIDLDAASGAGSNAAVLDDVVRDGALDIQAGGGVQSTSEIERLADAGANRIILGPRAIAEPEWLESTVTLFPGLLVLATDVHERRVVTRGWVHSLPVDLLDLVEEIDTMPLAGLLLSIRAADISRSPDLALVEDVAEACPFELMVDADIASMNDMRALQHRGVAGVVLDDELRAGGALEPHDVAMEFGT